MKRPYKPHSRHQTGFSKGRKEGFGTDRKDSINNDRKEGFANDRDRKARFSDDRKDRFSKDRKDGFGKDRQDGFSKDRKDGFSNDSKDRFGKDRFGKNRKAGFSKDRREGFSSDRKEGFSKDRRESFSNDRNDRFGKDRKDGFKKGPRDGERPFQKHFKKTYVPAAQLHHDKPLDKPQQKSETLAKSGDGVLLWGLHAVREAWLNPKRRISRLWATESGEASFTKTIADGKSEGLARPNAKRVERAALENFVPPGSVHQGIVIEAVPLHEPQLYETITTDNPPDLMLVLDQVTDPHNVGAIVRSAAAFGVGGIVMTERNAPGLTGVLAKSASGAIEHVPLIHIVNLARAIEELQQAGYWCVGLAEEGPRELSQCDLKGRTALVLGAEGEGLRQLTRKKCDELARLPTSGAIGSLNVSNAAAVALYEVRRQKGKSSS